MSLSNSCNHSLLIMFTHLEWTQLRELCLLKFLAIRWWILSKNILQSYPWGRSNEIRSNSGKESRNLNMEILYNSSPLQYLLGVLLTNFSSYPQIKMAQFSLLQRVVMFITYLKPVKLDWYCENQNFDLIRGLY